MINKKTSNEMIFYNLTINEIFNYFKSDYKGLTKSKVKENSKKYGKNEIKEKKQKNFLIVFFSQFNDILIFILLICAIISVFINEIESTLIIVLVLLINSILGTYQYYKAEKSIQSLKNLQKTKCKVIRNNKHYLVDSSELVCGDIVIIETGNIICADGRIIECNDIEINESSLTGESNEVEKNVNTLFDKYLNLGEIDNMVFSGTTCVKGNGKYIVCKTGLNTEIGKIASIIKNTKKNKTPLQLSIDKFSKILSIIIILICISVFILGIYRQNDIFNSIMFSISLAVAAIPEALSTIVVIVLAIGMEKMAKEKAVIKELKAVEGLGSVSIIASDKTGTITDEIMSIKECFYLCDILSFKKYLYYSITSISSPTENAIKDYFTNDIKEEGMKIKELSFTSKRKMSSNVYLIDGMKYLFCKGACEKILNNCIYYLKSKGLGNEIERIDIKIKRIILDKIKEYTSCGLRVMAVAYKKISNQLIEETDMVFVGIICLSNNVRTEVYQAIKNCEKAHIKTIMLTGDYLDTAEYIAKEVNIKKEGTISITGDEIEKMSDDELYLKINDVSVCARLDPIHKIRIIKALQANDKIVAMTGDGINDAPSLKLADIGIAMGNGTDVAKDVSDIILLDNDFSSIVKAISNGRTIYINIQNAIIFLLSGNFAGILMVLYCSLLNLPIPFVSVHLLFINLITDSLPAIAIGVENNPRDVLKDYPRKKNEFFLNRRISLTILFEGILIAICVLINYHIGLTKNIMCARTMAFLTLALSRLFHSFNCNSEECIITKLIRFRNINFSLILSFLIGFVLVNAVIFLPNLSKLLYTSSLTRDEVIYVYLLSMIPLFLIQTYKLLRTIIRKIKKN